MSFRKTYIKLFFVLFFVMIITGCSEKVQRDLTESGRLQENIMGGVQPESEKSEWNQFFMGNEYNSRRYKGRFSSSTEEDMIERDVYLKAERIAELKSGVIYKLKIQPIEGVSEERLLLGTFCVQKDKIYEIEYTKENIEKMKREDKIPTGSNIVCQEKEVKDHIKHKEKGFHQYLLVKGDLREYHSYNNKVESGYFETYTWKRHTGLMYYKSGCGAEKDLVELKLLNE